MERDVSHTVNIINSAKGVNVYSTIGHEFYAERTVESGYSSFDDAQDEITGKLRDMYGFAKLYKRLTNAEKVAFGIFVIKDVITTLTTNGEHNDLLPILGIMGAYFLTKVVEGVNINNAVLTKHRLLTVKEAQKQNAPQFEKVFPLFSDQNSET